MNIYEDLHFDFPPTPKKKEILNWDLPTKKQKWISPNVKEIDALPDGKEKNDLIEVEYKRRRDGLWFYNNGVETYITGHHYYYLTYCEFNFGSPQYRDVDRRFFYVWDIVEKDNNCYGLLRLKFRRLGATSQGEAIGLNISSDNYKVHCGIVSKTGGDAKDVFDEVVDLMNNLVDYAKPPLESKDRPKKVISFKAPTQSVTHKNPLTKKQLSLDSKLDYRATTKNAYDGRKLRYLFIDESAKWEDISFDEFWQIHRTCLVLGGRIFGKAYIPTTCNEMELSGGKEFKSVWDDSSTSEKNANNRTRSGNYRIFFPAYDGFEGFIDEYGFSVIDTPTPEQAKFLCQQFVDNGGRASEYKAIGAREFIMNERRALENDPAKLWEYMREFPFNEAEAFFINNKQSNFDLVKINQQLEFNSQHTNLGTRGNFVWKNGIRDTEVEWQPNENGRWIVFWLPNVEDRNKKIITNGRKYPANEFQGCFGCDPIDQARTNDGKGSMFASVGMRGTQPLDTKTSNIIVCSYKNRLPVPEMYYEDMILQCVFYGYPILGERNKPGCINYFKQRGYYGENTPQYIMSRTEETQVANSIRSKYQPWIPTASGEVTGIQLGFVQTFIYEFVGVNDTTGSMGRFYCSDTLRDCLTYDPNGRLNDFDMLVAFMFALTGIRRTVPKQNKSISFNFKKFNNSGMQSSPIRS